MRAVPQILMSVLGACLFGSAAMGQTVYMDQRPWDPALAFGEAPLPDTHTACSEAWPADPAAQSACVRAERSAQAEIPAAWRWLGNFYGVLGVDDPQATITTSCAHGHFASGTHMAYRLTLDCIRQETAAYRALMSTVESTPAITTTAQQCLDRWPSDPMAFRLTINCVNG
ncbi:hypothetical protein [Pyruvatibacter sp.]